MRRLVHFGVLVLRQRPLKKSRIRIAAADVSRQSGRYDLSAATWARCSSSHNSSNATWSFVLQNQALARLPKGASPSKRKRLPSMMPLHENSDIITTEEFPTHNNETKTRGEAFRWMQLSQRQLASLRILNVAWRRVVEPPTLHILAMAACTTVGIAAIEGSLLCIVWPWQCPHTAQFVARYAMEQLFPSVVWETQEATLVAASLGLDPTQILQPLPGTDVRSANLILATHFLATSRYFFAGFMMIGQLFRAANLSIEALEEYKQRIVNGREPPLRIQNGLVVRLCGRDSHVSEVSLARMRNHFFPVYENPDRVKFLLWKHSEQKRLPVYWCVRSGLYGSSYSWDKFPATPDCFFSRIPSVQNDTSSGIGTTSNSNNTNSDSKDTKNIRNILVLEADATNGNDPLTLGDKAMDLTIEDASQGFRQILERFAANGMVRGRDFHALRIYLGNSMEMATTGGGHKYTLRHRIQYAREMDVLIDSRAAVLHKILQWCDSVAAKERKIFFQTSSREYFLNLQQLLKEYGYEIYDPLDLRMFHKARPGVKQHDEAALVPTLQHATTITPSLLSILLEDKEFMEEEWHDHKDFLEECYAAPASTNPHPAASGKMEAKNGPRPLTQRHEMLRHVAKMAKLPRLVHMKTTAETVNAVDALILAGEVNASSCCALIDRQEGVSSLENSLAQRKDFKQTKGKFWINTRLRSNQENASSGGEKEDAPTTSGLQIICSSSIHDDVLRQVRLWARMGYTATEIQSEIDAQYQEILQRSLYVQQQVRDNATAELHAPTNAGSSEVAPKDAEQPLVEEIPEDSLDSRK